MTAPARLLGLRVQGFKSFAERTLVEFGPGISAVVGPNGSGKSNLADALRWALGEQGRSLRIRKSEDVIWAGSERRGALGMADVTLVLDNADALLPVEYSVVELERRLYRSGENDYLLNRQRVRLRDLVDLLDAANLAENAFLFIGQGMVDQALALRPEERRPLFEEVAGVRRHERRRRKAEEQLSEAEANLARVEDILAELRPQARRLGQLAEQQATRMTAGEELADALIAAAHARWHEAAARVGEAERRRAAVGSEIAQALAALEAGEQRVAELASSMATRGETERERRTAHEAARADLTTLGLREARSAGELQASERDRERLTAERSAGEADLASQRRILAEPVREPDLELEAVLGEADRALADALAELGGLRAANRARGEELAALRRAESARAAEAEMARRRHAEASRRAADERALAADASRRRDELEAAFGAARAALGAAIEDERGGSARRAAAAATVDALDGERRAAAERAERASLARSGASARLEQAERQRAEEEDRGIARAARRLGGHRVDQDLAVDPAFRAAVEAALGDLVRAYVVDREGALGLASERGSLVVRERLATGNVGGPADSAPRPRDPGASARLADARFTDQLARVGGGLLRDAVRRDPAGAVGALLAQVAWVPDLAGALELQGALPPGWLAVTRDGSAVADGLTVRIGRGDSPLERQAGVERLAREAEALVAGSQAADAELASIVAALSAARTDLERARQAESQATAARRRAEEAERITSRDLEAAAREAGWHVAQADRLAAEAARVEATLASADAGPIEGRATVGGRSGASTAAPATPEAEAIVAWEGRIAELRQRRDRLARDAATHDRARRDQDARRARAEAAIAMAEARIAAADREIGQLAERERLATEERASVGTQLAAAAAREARARADLDALLADDRAERSRLADAERAATAARERLRAADERTRAADVAVLESRLGLDGLREQLLVELAGLGELALRHLSEALGGRPSAADPVEGGEAVGDGVTAEEADMSALDDDGRENAALAEALEAIGRRWATTPPPAEPPTPARLGVLRRRFHELGAANPFAVDEYRSVRERLETLDGQARDLRDAIAKTRALIADLDQLIATQFRATFAALELAFDARFRQLFDGGFAKLSLTDPTDLAATGIDILARPPGKKPQALAMLSGGERALTAVALLFAMLEVRPAPFCVLDEVDAALDEANVGRFTDALRSLSERTQFVVITHNRGTIEVADALYGVTVGDDSVSRVISLRLEQAQAIADRRRPDAPAVLAIEPAG